MAKENRNGNDPKSNKAENLETLRRGWAGGHAGSNGHADSENRTQRQGSAIGGIRIPREGVARDVARSAHGARLSDRRGSEDLPGPVYLRQRGYAIRDDRRPTPRAKHYRPGRLAAHGWPRLQRGVRGLRF